MIIKQLNQKRTLIAIILCVAIFFSLIAPSLVDVFGASYNVVQSRHIAEIDEFPESYRDGLRYVQKIYPNAKFILYDTGLDWNKDLLTKENQLRVGVNLVGSHVDDFWKSKDSAVYNAATNTYTEIEPGWNQVSSEGIQYYMDPRNFFNEKDIFMFLNLEYDGTQTVEGTAAVIANSFMKGNIQDNDGNEISYAEALHKIGQKSGVSPYLLACRIRQEQGSGRSAMISGHYGNYPGYYNHFNIGAYGNTTSTILNRGLSYAKSQGWDTPYKSILGGAKVLAESYVKSGKNTLYLQHFNMVANSSGTVSYSVYMANIQAPYSENRMMISSFTDNNTPYTFVIPVYKNMPKAPVKPPKYNIAEDCNIKSIAIVENCDEFTNFDKYSYNYDAKLNQFANTLKLQVELEAKENVLIINNTIIPNEDGKTVIDYEVKLVPGFNTVSLVCKSETGMSRTYTLNVINDDGKTHFKSTVYNLNSNAEYFIPNAPCTVESLKQSINVLNGTVLVIDKDNKNKDNDMLCFASDTLLIRSNDGKIVYKKPIVIYGDVNCDGLLNDIDVNLIKEHILEIGTLFKDELKYADVNRDGMVTVEDIGSLENIIKTTTNDASDSITFSPQITKNEENNGHYKLTLSIPEVPCVTEGFLVYNEGGVATINATNSGRIHFVTDGSNVLFENGFNELDISPVLESNNVDFQVEILSSYHYMLKKDIDINIDKFQLIQPELDEKGNEIALEQKDEPIPEGAHIHEYVYHNNNDATLTNSATQSGSCVHCGKLNTKILHGTRMELVEKIEITISQARLGKGGLPAIGTVAPPVKKVSPVWRDQNGSVELIKSEDIVVNVGDTYQLGKIILTPTPQCVFDEDTKLYINGKPFDGEPTLFGNRIVFSSLGEFKF